MQLISLEAISHHYTPIILWLQEVDEQVRADSRVKAGVFFADDAKIQHLFLY